MIDETAILYRDNHVLVAVKPAGLLTQPSGTNRPNMEDMLKAWLKDVLQKPGNVYLHAVHRIDTAVSGIVLFALSSKGLSRLNKAMREKAVAKVYHAWIDGRLPEDRGRLEHWLVHGDHKAILASRKNPNAKQAILDYVVLKRVNGGCLVELMLQTGRYHQIRAQLSAINCPIRGDAKYGSTCRFEGIALHSRSISFPHPVTREALSFTAPYPEAWSLPDST